MQITMALFTTDVIIVSIANNVLLVLEKWFWPRDTQGNTRSLRKKKKKKPRWLTVDAMHL